MIPGIEKVEVSCFLCIQIKINPFGEYLNRVYVAISYCFFYTIFG